MSEVYPAPMFATCVPANTKKRKRVVLTNSPIIATISSITSTAILQSEYGMLTKFCLAVRELNPFQMSRNCATMLVLESPPDFARFLVTSVGGRLSKGSPRWLIV